MFSQPASAAPRLRRTPRDIHTGVPEEVIASLQADTALARATDWSVQVHSIDPPHPYILRAIELVAQVVAPALGWKVGAPLG